MTLPAEWPHPCPLLDPWWGVRHHWSWEPVCGKQLREQGAITQGHRDRLARVGGRGNLDWGFTLHLLPLPLNVQIGPCGDFSEEQNGQRAQASPCGFLTAVFPTGMGYRSSWS